MLRFQSAEHDLDPVAPFVATLVAFHRFLALFPARDAGAYPFVFQRFPEPVGIISAVPEPSVDVRQAVEQCPRADVIADLTGGDKEVDRSAFAIVLEPMAHHGSSVADGMEFGVHAALGASNQASPPPFLAPRLVAVRCAVR